MTEIQSQHAGKYESQQYRSAASRYENMDAASAHYMNATRGGEYGGKFFQDTYGVKESMYTSAPRQVLVHQHHTTVPHGDARAAAEQEPLFRRHQRHKNIVAGDARGANAPQVPSLTTRIPPTTPRIPTKQAAPPHHPTTTSQFPATPYGIRERPITPFGLRFRYRQWCRNLGELWVDCRGQIKGKITLIIRGPDPVDNVQENYDLSDRKSGRNARKSPASARR